ncbi:hypothetical protein [Paenibacillus sp. B1-33]|uniref:hypothetical protein n=1 Tax=unclassified Paenibacillus TaxID=185978 RepID=UPI003D27EE64
MTDPSVKQLYGKWAKLIFRRRIWNGYAITLIYTIIGTVINLAMTIAAAYPLTRIDLAGRQLFTTMISLQIFLVGDDSAIISIFAKCFVKKGVMIGAIKG